MAMAFKKCLFEQGRSFFDKLVTMDESWVSYSTPELKKIKTVASRGNAVLDIAATKIIQKRGFKTGSCFSCFGGKNLPVVIFKKEKKLLIRTHKIAAVYEQICPCPRSLPPFFHTQLPLSAWARPFSLYLFLW